MQEPKKLPNYRTDKSKVVNLEMGRLPPQAVDLERAVLGAMMIDSKAPDEAISIIRRKEIFYKSSHQLIYNAILELFDSSEPVDILTVSKNLKKKGELDTAGGDFYLIELTQTVASSAHIDFHCRIIMQQFVKRDAIRVANEIITNSYRDETDIFDLLATSQKEIDETAQWLIRKQPQDFKSIVDAFFDKAENDVAGVPNSLRKLQYKLNGYRPKDLIIVAARPGMGKTALILNEAKAQAKKGIPVGIFSLEMSAHDLVGRMLANECGIDYSAIHKNTLTDFEKRLMSEKRAEFEKLPIHIHDQAGLTPLELKVQAGKWIREFGVQILYLDYLQLMSASGKNESGNREQEISSISRSLKATAMDFNVPLIALSQLSRAVENRGGMKRPMLSDLRESGAIEQDADIVMFLLRPEYYKIDSWDDESRSSTHNQCEINIAKFRGGEVGACIVNCELRYMRFSDIEETPWEPVPEPQDPKKAFEPIANDIPDSDEDDNHDIPF